MTTNLPGGGVSGSGGGHSWPPMSVSVTGGVGGPGPQPTPSIETILADINKIVTAVNQLAPNIPVLKAAPEVLQHFQAAAPDLATAAATLESLVPVALQLIQLLVALGVKLPIPLP